MNIKVLGPGCTNCKTLYRRTQEALEGLGLEGTIDKVEAYEEIAKFGTFIRSRGIKPDSLSTFDAELVKLADKFDIPKTSLDRMEKVLEADKVHPDENLFERSVPFVERELKQEIARMVWRPEERFRVWHTDDTELITAMTYFPQATELLASRLALRKE